MRSVYICCFTAGLEDLKRKQQADPAAVLRAMDQAKRFSVFEATANQVIAKTVDHIFRLGYVKSMGGAYPWTHVELTDAGRELLAKEPQP